MKMKMFSSKSDLYDRLWRDYREFKKRYDEDADAEDELLDEEKQALRKKSRERIKESFIYRYYKDKKTELAKELAKDPAEFEAFRNSFNRSDNKFVLLCAARLLLENNKLSAEEYKKIFEFAKSSIYLSRKFSADPCSEKAYEQLSYKLICKYVDKIFYDDGYRQNKTAQPKNDSKSDRIDDIEMLYRYFLYTKSEGVYAEQSAEADAEYRALCAELYGAVSALDGDTGDLYIPLFIDPTAGAGVYIIGDRNLGRIFSDGCGVYVKRFAVFDPDGDVYEDIDEDGETEVKLTFRLKKYKSVEEAFKAFDAEVSDDRKNGFMACNEALPLELFERDGMEVFLKYIGSAFDIEFQSREAQKQKQIDAVLKAEAEQKAKETAEAKEELRRRKEKR